ncbi:NikS protein [Streptomyces sp. ST2-7A]|uniref:ATP-binding protein n=1 Tax=Streptomyces sp. ST2-7A TaxID=2907214 RepID=UPI001F212F36|nr:NikS protein [Streptomyces sp. ST2-7A]MCE7079531.1 NikS protein [Streptomyces sp. ST2-7A]
MTILVLHRGSLRANPYAEWFEGRDDEVVLLASAEQLAAYGEDLPEKAPFVHAEALPDYDVSPRVIERAEQLIREHRIRDIVACQENDIERAARLRERFGLPGQLPDTAVVYRDKWTMKRVAADAGIPVAPCASVRDAGDVSRFVADHGLPVVVKPRRSAGSIGLSVLRTEEDVRGWNPAEHPVGPPGPEGEAAWLVEAFVAGDMHHVDGVVLDGEVVTMWPSHYTYVLADYRDRGGRVDIAHDMDSPLGERLVAFAERVLEAFGGPPDFAFHIEVFHTPDDRLVLCEAACRAGGAGVRDVQREMFGFDPAVHPVRRQLGLPVPVSGRRSPTRLAGQLLFTKRPGVLVALPDPADLPDDIRASVAVSHYFATPGERVPDARHSGDFLAAFVITGADRGECEARIRAVESWFLAGLAMV